MPFKINDKVSFVGKIDWNLRKFHGEELSTQRGSSYNAYLIQDEKNVLIDSVWLPYADEFIKNLSDIINIKKIDYIICNHSEPDHSGALPKLMEIIPDVPIYCSKMGVKSIQGHYHKDWNFVPVKTGDKLNIGSGDLMFVEMSMIHWPDSMMTYYTKNNILFSNDAFGQHLADEKMYNDLYDKSIIDYEAMKYYANIVAPFSKKVVKKIEEIKALNLPIDMICPSHGLIWRNNPLQIIDKYEKWANDFKEDQITIIYETMYDSTRHMAEAIAEGIKQQDQNTNIRIYNAANSDRSDVMTEIFRSKGVIIGSPTVNNGILSSVAAIVEELIGFGLTGKKAAAFGAYGWSPTSTKIIQYKTGRSWF